MGAVPRPQDTVTRLAALEKRITVMERTSRLGQASIGEGGLVVRNGGVITIEDGGSITITGGGGLSITDGGDISLDGGDLSINSGDIEVSGAGGIRVSDGGSIAIDDGGDITLSGGDLNVTSGGDIIVSGTGQVRSSDYVANTTGWRIANGSAEFNTITLRNGIVGVDALTRRSEGATFSAEGSSMGGTRTQSVTVNVPTWAQTVSVLGIGVSSAGLAGGISMNSAVKIGGTAEGPVTEASSDLKVALPATHARTFAVAGGSSFDVSVRCGISGSGVNTLIIQTISVICQFTRG